VLTAILLALGVVTWTVSMFWVFGPWSALILLIPALVIIAGLVYMLFAVKIDDYGE
jgi:hypothetical protein